MWRLLPLKRDLAVFAAYWYGAYSCNPRAIYERLRELEPSVRAVWVTASGVQVPPGVDTVRPGSRAYFRALARATYFVNNVGFPDHWRKRQGTVLVHTHHGTPLKLMGLDQLERTEPGRPLTRHLARWARWDYSVSSNWFSTVVWERAYPGRYTSLDYGYPRNDRLATATPADGATLREQLGLPAGGRILLYAPTHREYEPGFRALLDVHRLAAELGDGWTVLVRAHYFYSSALPDSTSAAAGVVDVSAHPSIEDLCLVADVLVTDYSSLMFDYAVLDRPIIVFAPDWETYRLLRGTYLDVTTTAPGVVCRTEDELVESLVSGRFESSEAADARKVFRDMFCAWDDGQAAERVVRRVFQR